jgi:heavy metal translocating P-type ATPase
VPVRVTPMRILLLVSVAGVAAGAAAHGLGFAWAGDALWAATAAAALIPAVVEAAGRLWRRSAGVDVIAVLAIAGALALQEFLAAAVIGLMLATGRALEEYAAHRAERELSALLQRAPRNARRLRGNAIDVIPVAQVAVGDLLVVNGGDIVPVDGVVAAGAALLDESALTGESRPVERAMFEAVASGVVNAGTPFTLRATTTSERSTYSGIIRMVRQAQQSKAPLQRLADRYAQWFVPLTLTLAGGAWLVSGSPERALAVLVVATPCPLLLAAPIAIVSGVSRAARRGVVVKGGAALETLARSKAIYLDKTGTLTLGAPRLQRLAVADTTFTDERILALAASLDQMSSHVFADAIVKAARDRGYSLSLPSDVNEIPGAGIEGIVDSERIRVGKFDWVAGDDPSGERHRFRRRVSRDGGSLIFVSVGSRFAGAFVFDDPIRADAPRAIRRLKRLGFEDVVMLTGDRAAVADSVGAALGVDHVRAELAPEDKVEAVRRSSRERATVMVGDGINDAPALAAADVGIAMGARGATSSSEAADAVLVVDRLDRLVEAVEIAQRSRSIAIQSIVLGMGLSLVAMCFASFGLLAPVAGALLQEAIDVAAILSALRALRGKPGAAVTYQLPAETAIALRREHIALIPLVERLRGFADQLEDGAEEPWPAGLQELRESLATIVEHEQRDEHEVYREIAAGLRGDDPLAAMSRTHQEVFHLARQFERLMADLDGACPEEADLVDLRRLLYALHAVLRLNIAQEEELYFALDREYAGV